MICVEQLSGDEVVHVTVFDDGQSPSIVLTLPLCLPERSELVGDELIADSCMDLQILVSWDLLWTVCDRHA